MSGEVVACGSAVARGTTIDRMTDTPPYLFKSPSASGAPGTTKPWAPFALAATAAAGGFGLW